MPMNENRSDLPWKNLVWLEQARAWISHAVDASGQRLTRPVDQFHIQPWSTVMRVYTDAGLLYFKASANPKELRLTLLLRDLQPENLPDLLAWDTERNWFLMRDAGTMLRAFLKNPSDLALAEPALRQYARLQIQAAGERERILAVGAEERALERLPGMLGEMLDDEAILRVGQADGLTTEQHARLVELAPRYAELCARLAEYRVPETLHHDDFHDANVFVLESEGERRFIFSDWEESFLAHPFFSVMLFLRSAGSRAGFPDEATEAPERMPEELNRLRDAYLEGWEVYESRARLVEAFNLAWRVGMVSRALTWRAFVRTLEPERRGEYAYIVPAWLGEFLLAMG